MVDRSQSMIARAPIPFVVDGVQSINPSKKRQELWSSFELGHPSEATFEGHTRSRYRDKRTTSAQENSSAENSFADTRRSGCPEG